MKLDIPWLTNNSDLSYWDYAATAPCPQAVIDRISTYLAKEHTNVRRGQYQLSVDNTAHVEAIRQQVANFFHAPSDMMAIFTAGATAGLNQIAGGLDELLQYQGHSIVVTADAHHANLVPWQELAKRTARELIMIPVTPDSALDMDAWQAALATKPAIVALTHVSNVTGTIHPIKDLSAAAHAAGASVIVDGAQAVAHLCVDLTDLDVDAYVFSAHKLYAPTGTGVILGKQDFLAKLHPLITGGGMIDAVTETDATWAPLPERLEAGTPNLVGIIGLGATLTWLTEQGWPAVLETEKQLTVDTLKNLTGIPTLKLYGSTDPNQRIGVFAFTVEGVHPHDLAEILAERNVAIRAGHHCAMPLHTSWGIPATARASAGLGTTTADIDRLTAAIQDAITIFHPHG